MMLPGLVLKLALIPTVVTVAVHTKTVLSGQNGVGDGAIINTPRCAHPVLPRRFEIVRPHLCTPGAGPPGAGTSPGHAVARVGTRRVFKNPARNLCKTPGPSALESPSAQEELVERAACSVAANRAGTSSRLSLSQSSPPCRWRRRLLAGNFCTMWGRSSADRIVSRTYMASIAIGLGNLVFKASSNAGMQL